MDHIKELASVDLMESLIQMTQTNQILTLQLANQTKMIADQAETITKQTEDIKSLLNNIDTLTLRISGLEETIRELQRKFFRTSSEKLSVPDEEAQQDAPIQDETGEEETNKVEVKAYQ